MAASKPVGDNARKGAVKKRSQSKKARRGAPGASEQDLGDPGAKKKAAKKFNGVRRET